MKVVDRFNVSKEPEGPRKFTFEFTGPGLISVVVVGIIGVVWVFILGVLVGRGYKPENAVPQVAQIMPSAPPQAQENKEPPKVLKPEELNFQDTLQGRKPPETVTVDSTAQKDQAKAAPVSPQTPGQASGLAAGGAAPAPVAGAVPTTSLEKTPAPLPKGQVATAPAQPDRKTPQADPAKDPKAASKDPVKDSKDKPKDSKDKAKDAKETKDAKDQKYQLTFQVAALDSRGQAQAEVDRLARKGLKASLEEVKIDGKTLFRVTAQVKGTEAEARQTLEKAGAKKPILREKKSL